MKVSQQNHSLNGTNKNRKPEWLLKKVFFSQKKEVEQSLKSIGIHTVCQEAMCPNISECFAKKQATFMLLGDTCTRACTFCNVHRGTPQNLDEEEPQKVAQAVKALGLKHVVITSVTRDDLKDGGASVFVAATKKIQEIDKNITIELLIPDLRLNLEALKSIALCGAQIVAHNIETVPRLYHIRKGANYQRSLDVLRFLKESNPHIKTKSSLMLGLGETKEELQESLNALLEVGCTLLTLGQYLAPSKSHESVKEYIEPKRFEEFGHMALDMGFEFVKSSPYTRSSYMSHEYFERDKLQISK
jgi:lipoic acid synthetase